MTFSRYNFIRDIVIYSICTAFLVNMIIFEYKLVNNIYNSNIYQFTSQYYIHPLFCFLDKIVETIRFLVHQYFITFRFCWQITLVAFVNLIDNYITFLGYVVGRLTSFPFCLYGTLCVFICMVAIVTIIFKLFK